MLKKYIPTFSKKSNRKSSSFKKRTAFYSFLEKSSQRKYSKRKKSLLKKVSSSLPFLQKISLKYSIIWGGLTCIIWLIATVIFSTYASISSINIYREGSLIDINRAYNQLDYLRWKNILAIDGKSIAQRLQKSQVSISSIRISKRFPDTLNIYLNSYDIIFQTPNYLILKNGSIILKENTDPSNVPLIYISEDIWEYVDFQKTLNAQEIKKISILLTEATKNIFWFNAQEVFYFVKERELIVRNSDATLYIFDLQQDVDVQIRRIAIYKQESWVDSEQSQVYIDVRIPEKLFFCWNDVENICNNNIRSIYWDMIFNNPSVVVSESPL